MSQLYKLNSSDFIKGAATAVFSGVIFAVYGIVSQDGFNLFTVDWANILSMAVNAGVAAFVGYIGKNFMTAENGKVFGVLG